MRVHSVVLALVAARLFALDPAPAFGFACGNGLVEPGEECDDGNTLSGDGCSSTCVSECPRSSGIWAGPRRPQSDLSYAS